MRGLRFERRPRLKLPALFHYAQSESNFGSGSDYYLHCINTFTIFSSQFSAQLINKGVILLVIDKNEEYDY